VAILEDILAPNLDVVFCGTAVASASAARGHYFAGPGNKFWRFLHVAGFTPVQLTPDQDWELPKYGVGITDLVKHVAQSHDRGLDFKAAPDLEVRLRPFAPKWVAFVGLNAGAKGARAFGHPAPRHGAQDWLLGSSSVFVVTNPSGAAADPTTWDGKAAKVDWWHELAALIAK
jgi:TDG/mug DNA glycosylase family protein